MSLRRQRADIFLLPGDVTVQTQPATVRTILGSCVAVCLWDPVLRAGGMNHFLLARPQRSDTPSPRYGSVATIQLIERLCSLGAPAARLVASVIGGGRPVDTISANAIGDENTAMALAILREHGIRVVRQETGGAHGRKILFNTATGELLVDRLRSNSEVLQGGRRS